MLLRSCILFLITNKINCTIKFDFKRFKSDILILGDNKSINVFCTEVVFVWMWTTL